MRASQATPVVREECFEVHRDGESLRRVVDAATKQTRFKFGNSGTPVQYITRNGAGLGAKWFDGEVVPVRLTNGGW
jgi:hypothetical protein